jgi:von Willebrand factor type A domain/IPT/TIG domain
MADLFKKLLIAILITILTYSNFFGISALANTGSSSTNHLVSVIKSINTTKITTENEAEVTLTVKGTPQQTSIIKPNDIVLIIDKSGSMSYDNRLEAAKNAAKEFIDLIDLTKHRVGIVDFSDSASTFPLTTDANAAKAYIDQIQLGGSTNTGDAVRKATSMLANHRPEAQPTIIILTDGAANSFEDAKQSAAAAKNAGIVFYSIALLAPNEDPDKSAPNALLKEMATSATHHHFVLGSVGLPDIYKKIVQEIGLASAYNVTITDTVASEFEIVPDSYKDNIPKPTINGNTLTWNITELKTETLTLKYKIRVKESTQIGTYILGTTKTEYLDHENKQYSFITVNPSVNVLYPAPQISSIEANKGLISGGETVVIKGKNFRPGAKVYFGSYLATIQSINSTEISVLTPIGSQGSVTVKVQNDDGQYATDTFTYYAIPTISYVTPNEGSMKGGNKIAVIGSYFMPGIKVYINDKLAATEFATSSKVYAIVPSSDVSGKVKVSIENPDGTTAELQDAYNYIALPPAPAVELHSLTPTSGNLNGGDQVYLIGANFDRNMKVYFGDQEAPINYYANSSKVRVTTPAATNPGFVNVKVVNPDGSFAELQNAFEYLAPPPAPAPQVTSLTPAEALVGEQKLVYIFGNNISSKAKVYFGGIEVPMTFITTSKIRVTIPISTTPGSVDVTIVNPDGKSGTLVNGFTYIEPVPDPAPIINSLSNTKGSVTGGNLVTVYGQNFKQGIQVYFGDRQGTVTKFISSNEIEVSVPSSASAGLVDVKVVNPDGQSATLTDGYTYEGLQPTITSLSPNSGSKAGGNYVYIFGTNFNNKMTVTVDGQTVAYTYLSTEKIRIRMPASSTAKTVDIVVNRDGLTATAQYTYY